MPSRIKNRGFFIVIVAIEDTESIFGELIIQ